MSINVIERNGSSCKCVEIFIHHVDSIGAPNRRTVFINNIRVYYIIVILTDGVSTLSWWWSSSAPESLRAMPAVA
jgi:hypothetical protein